VPRSHGGQGIGDIESLWPAAWIIWCGSEARAAGGGSLGPKAPLSWGVSVTQYWAIRTPSARCDTLCHVPAGRRSCPIPPAAGTSRQAPARASSPSFPFGGILLVCPCWRGIGRPGGGVGLEYPLKVSTVYGAMMARAHGQRVDMAERRATG